MDLTNWLSRYKGVFDVSDDLRPGKQEVGVRLKAEATNLGLDAQTIADQLRAAFFGTTVSEIQVGADSRSGSSHGGGGRGWQLVLLWHRGFPEREAES